jgi:hypothetical protein
MHPTNIVGANVILKGDASRGVSDLKVMMRKYADGTQTVTSEWKMTLSERIFVLFTGSIFVSVATDQFPPIKVQVENKA